jgi:hypothetical protein
MSTDACCWTFCRWVDFSGPLLPPVTTGLHAVGKNQGGSTDAFSALLTDSLPWWERWPERSEGQRGGGYSAEHAWVRDPR